jgi:hypothetical protein
MKSLVKISVTSKVQPSVVVDQDPDRMANCVVLSWYIKYYLNLYKTQLVEKLTGFFYLGNVIKNIGDISRKVRDNNRMTKLMINAINHKF